jgi:hypothetical protein
MLFPMIKVLYVCTFRSMCAVPNMAFFLWFPDDVLSIYITQVFFIDSEMVSVGPIVSDTTFVFTYHTRYMSVLRSLYFKTFPASLNHISHVLEQTCSCFSLSCLFLGMVVPVYTSCYPNMVTLFSCLVCTDIGIF